MAGGEKSRRGRLFELVCSGPLRWLRRIKWQKRFSIQLQSSDCWLVFSPTSDTCWALQRACSPWMSCCILVEQPECGRSSYLFCFLYRRKVRDGENCNDIDGAVGLYVYVSRERVKERDWANQQLNSLWEWKSDVWLETEYLWYPCSTTDWLWKLP